MPSADDLFNQLVAANTRLEDIKGDLVDVKGAVNQVQTAVMLVNTTLTNGFSQLVTLGQYTNQALYQNDLQNDTMICLLEHISKNTCALLNEAAAVVVNDAPVVHLWTHALVSGVRKGVVYPANASGEIWLMNTRM